MRFLILHQVRIFGISPVPRRHIAVYVLYRQHDLEWLDAWWEEKRKTWIEAF